jgi:hypothetical protein
MFWRPGRGEIKGKWHGPARIIIQESRQCNLHLLFKSCLSSCT